MARSFSRSTPSRGRGMTRDLALEPGAPAGDGRLALARPLQHQIEGTKRLFYVVLVELGELEPQARIVELGAQCFEVTQRSSAIASRLGDLAAHAERTCSDSALDG